MSCDTARYAPRSIQSNQVREAGTLNGNFKIFFHQCTRIEPVFSQADAPENSSRIQKKSQTLITVLEVTLGLQDQSSLESSCGCYFPLPLLFLICSWCSGSTLINVFSQIQLTNMKEQKHLRIAHSSQPLHPAVEWGSKTSLHNLNQSFGGLE